MGNIFDVGDLVKVNKTGEIGKVVKIETIGDDYRNYVVKIADFDRIYNESYLSLYRDNKDIRKIENVDFNNITYSLKIDDKIDSIIRKLNLEKSNDKNVHLKNACKLVEYLSLRNKDKEIEIIDLKDLKLNELYIGLSCSEDSIANA